MTSVEIRPAEKTDVPVIYRFMCDLADAELNEAEFIRCFDECYRQPNNYYLVACIDNNVVGFISCHGQMILHYGGYAYEIMELFVAADHRSRKVGKMLLDAIEDILSKVECKLLVVASNKRRVDAHRFYLSNGFQQTTFKFKKKIGN